MENPIKLGAEGVRYKYVLNLSGKRTELQFLTEYDHSLHGSDLRIQNRKLQMFLAADIQRLLFFPEPEPIIISRRKNHAAFNRSDYKLIPV